MNPASIRITSVLNCPQQTSAVAKNREYAVMKRNYLVVLVGSLCLWSAVTWGQSVYKWVDENGVVHFGARPPASAPGNREKQVEVVRQDRQKSNAELLVGSWWGRSRDGSVLNLTFYRGGSFVRVESRPETRSRIRVKGSYHLNNDGLVLEYEHSLRYEARFNEPQEFVVSSLDDRLLKLSHERRPLVLKRLQSTKATPLSGEIYGKWFDTNDRSEVFDFSHGRFKLLSRNGPHRFETRAEGNWDWNDPVLQLEVVIDYTRNQRYSSDIYQWRILKRHPDSITVRQSSDNRDMRLERLNML